MKRPVPVRVTEAIVQASLYPPTFPVVRAAGGEAPRWTPRALAHYRLLVEDVERAGEEVRLIRREAR